MSRGFRWCLYTSDTGQAYALQVDADYLEQPSRGWFEIDPTELPQFPRGWRARRVVGLDESGFTQSALVASTDADLWTGVAPTFDFNASDEQVHTATVIRTEAERRRP